MKTVDLLEELKRENSDVVKRDNMILAANEIISSQITEALQKSEQASIETLDNMGFDYNLIKEAEKVKDKRAMFSKLEPEKIFAKDQIKKTCIKYRLRFLETKYYKGHLGSEIILKYQELENKIGTIQKTKFYIMAPANVFQLTEKQVEPILFYDLGDDYFYAVYKWGNDFTIFRKIIYWPVASRGRLFSLFFVPFFLTLALTTFPWSIFSEVQPIWNYIFSFVVCAFGAAFISAMILCALEDAITINYSDDVWNKEYK